jgi:hypothetical protein
MADGVALQEHRGGFFLGIDQREARHRAGFHRHGPPAAAFRQRGGAHRGADHTLLTHLDGAEVGELLLLESIEIDAKASVPAVK